MTTSPDGLAEVYDPAVHASPAHRWVTCSRCAKEYVCLPWNDYYTPAGHLDWDEGGVCERCLLALARRKDGGA